MVEVLAFEFVFAFEVASLQAPTAIEDSRNAVNINTLVIIIPRVWRKRSPASPSAGDLSTEVLKGLTYFSFCFSELLLHLAFGPVCATARFKIAVVGELTKFGFDRSLDLLRFTFNFIFVTHRSSPYQIT